MAKSSTHSHCTLYVSFVCIYEPKSWPTFEFSRSNMNWSSSIMILLTLHVSSIDRIVMEKFCGALFSTARTTIFVFKTIKCWIMRKRSKENENNNVFFKQKKYVEPHGWFSIVLYKNNNCNDIKHDFYKILLRTVCMHNHHPAQNGAGQDRYFIPRKNLLAIFQNKFKYTGTIPLSHKLLTLMY